VRLAVLTISLAFVVGLAVLTVIDFVHNGPSAVGVLAVLIVVLFMIGIVGALRHPPS
jgi:hypothetical protein